MYKRILWCCFILGYIAILFYGIITTPTAFGSIPGVSGAETCDWNGEKQCSVAFGENSIFGINYDPLNQGWSRTATLTMEVDEDNAEKGSAGDTIYQIALVKQERMCPLDVSERNGPWFTVETDSRTDPRIHIIRIKLKDIKNLSGINSLEPEKWSQSIVIRAMDNSAIDCRYDLHFNKPRVENKATLTINVTLYNTYEKPEFKEDSCKIGTEEFGKNYETHLGLMEACFQEEGGRNGNGSYTRMINIGEPSSDDVAIFHPYNGQNTRSAKITVDPDKIPEIIRTLKEREEGKKDKKTGQIPIKSTYCVGRISEGGDHNTCTLSKSGEEVGGDVQVTIKNIYDRPIKVDCETELTTCSKDEVTETIYPRNCFNGTDLTSPPQDDLLSLPAGEGLTKTFKSYKGCNKDPIEEIRCSDVEAQFSLTRLGDCTTTGPPEDNRNMDFEVEYCTLQDYDANTGQYPKVCPKCNEFGSPDSDCPAKTEVKEIRIRAKKEEKSSNTYTRVFTVSGEGGQQLCTKVGNRLFGKNANPKWRDIIEELDAFMGENVGSVNVQDGAVKSAYTAYGPASAGNTIILKNAAYDDATLCFALKTQVGPKHRGTAPGEWIDGFSDEGIDEDITYRSPTLPHLATIYNIRFSFGTNSGDLSVENTDDGTEIKRCGFIDVDGEIREEVQVVIDGVEYVISEAVRVEYSSVTGKTEEKRWCVYTPIPPDLIPEGETGIYMTVTAVDGTGGVKEVTTVTTVSKPCDPNDPGCVPCEDNDPRDACKGKDPHVENSPIEDDDRDDNGFPTGCGTCECTPSTADSASAGKCSDRPGVSCTTSGCEVADSITLGNLNDINGGGERNLIEIPKQKESGLIIDCTFGKETNLDGTLKEQCGIKHLFELANNVMKLLLWLAIIGAGIVIFWKGVKLATNVYWKGGHDAARKEFQEALKAVLIGFIIILGAYAIVRAGFNIIGYDEEKLGDPFVFESEEVLQIRNNEPSDEANGGESDSDGRESESSSSVGDTTDDTTGSSGSNDNEGDDNNGIVDDESGTVTPGVTQAETDKCKGLRQHPGDGREECTCEECVSLQTIGITCKDNCKVTKNLKTALERFKNAHPPGNPPRWVVTEAWPPTRPHQADCHYNGTCVDINFRPVPYEHKTAENVARLKPFINKATGAGLHAIYEVPNTTYFEGTGKLFGSGSGQIKPGPCSSGGHLLGGIPDPHFSVYLDSSCG